MYPCRNDSSSKKYQYQTIFSPQNGKSPGVGAAGAFLSGACGSDAGSCCAMPVTTMAWGRVGQMYWQLPHPMQYSAKTFGMVKPSLYGTICKAPVGQCSAHAPQSRLSCVTTHRSRKYSTMPIRVNCFLRKVGKSCNAPLGQSEEQRLHSNSHLPISNDKSGIPIPCQPYCSPAGLSVLPGQ